jgi:regulation of enolase protein 1 (concanavalin A-like superfamily)
MRGLLLSCLLAASAFSEDAPLGVFTRSGDVGGPSRKGSAEFDASRKQYRITGAGATIWGRQDQLHFVWKEMSGDVAVTATMQFLGDGAAHRKAGIMLRQTLDSDSPYVDVVVHGDGMPAVQWRNAKGDITNTFDLPFEGPGKFSLKLVRRGSTVTARIGKDGAELKEVGHTQTQLAKPVLVGLAICSHVAEASDTAIFSDVSVEPLGTMELDMSDPKLWTVDVVHLGSKQIDITYDLADNAVIMRPTWSGDDVHSPDVATRNVEKGRLHSYQHIAPTDCTQSEVQFEINMPQAYIDEGKMEFVFSLQAGAAGDYLFNGHTYTMADFAGSGGIYKKLVVVPADYHEDLDKLRKIERVNLIFERRGSVLSAPIKIRNLKITLNENRIVPPAPDVHVTNPRSFYKFTYDTQAAIDALEVRVSAESMDITRRLDAAGDGLALIPRWGKGQVPEGHTGDVTIAQKLSAPHDFEPFRVEYVFNVPRAYLDDGRIQIVPFVQAGEKGHYVWSGVAKDLSSFRGKAGQDVVLTLSTEDFLANRQKKKNLIEMVGFKLDRHGSTVTEPIVLKSITVRLDDEVRDE